MWNVPDGRGFGGEPVAERARVGVVGCGLIAQVMHLPYLTELSGPLRARGGLRPARGRGRGLRRPLPACRASARAGRTLLDEPLDAVMIATSGDHAPIAIEAARAGLHVFVEKPMALSSADGERMVDAARQRGRAADGRHDEALRPGVRAAGRAAAGDGRPAADPGDDARVAVRAVRRPLPADRAWTSPAPALAPAIGERGAAGARRGARRRRRGDALVLPLDHARQPRARAEHARRSARRARRDSLRRTSRRAA